MDSWTIVALCALAFSVAGAVAYMSQRAGALETKVEGLEKTLATKEEVEKVRTTVALLDQSHENAGKTIDALNLSLERFRQDVKEMLRDFKTDMERFVAEHTT